MAVNVDHTPNPNALKFSVGEPVGGTGTFVKDSDPEKEFVAQLLELNGVASVFFTADFVTITKSPAATWDEIRPQATAILESHFGG